MHVCCYIDVCLRELWQFLRKKEGTGAQSSGLGAHGPSSMVNAGWWISERIREIRAALVAEI